jgi:hypothetical protein
MIKHKIYLIVYYTTLQVHNNENWQYVLGVLPYNILKQVTSNNTSAKTRNYFKID